MGRIFTGGIIRTAAYIAFGIAAGTACDFAFSTWQYWVACAALVAIDLSREFDKK